MFFFNEEYNVLILMAYSVKVSTLSGLSVDMALLDRKWVWGWVITGWGGKSIKVLFLEHLSFLTSLGGK